MIATWIGCALIIGAGIFVFLREQARQAPTPGGALAGDGVKGGVLEGSACNRLKSALPNHSKIAASSGAW